MSSTWPPFPLPNRTEKAWDGLLRRTLHLATGHWLVNYSSYTEVWPVWWTYSHGGSGNVKTLWNHNLERSSSRLYHVLSCIMSFSPTYQALGPTILGYPWAINQPPMPLRCQVSQQSGQHLDGTRLRQLCFGVLLPQLSHGFGRRALDREDRTVTAWRLSTTHALQIRKVWYDIAGYIHIYIYIMIYIFIHTYI